MSDVGVILTGQSLAVGGHDMDGNDAIETPGYPFKCYMLDPQPVGRVDEVLTSTVNELREDYSHTIGHSMTRHMSLYNLNNRIFFHGQAYGGAAYSYIKKGGSYAVYEKIMDQIDDILAYAPNTDYDCVCVIHGEADGAAGNITYALDLHEWLADFDTDVKAKTGQTTSLFMLQSQVSSACGYGYVGGISSTSFPCALEQLRAHEMYSGVVLACPKYFLQYYDHAHLSNASERLLGEYYYKAYRAKKDFGLFEPLRPARIYAGADGKIHIIFSGAVGQMVFDTTGVKAATNYGFAYKDLEGRTISSVAISGNEVVITITGGIGTSPWVSYAYQNGASGADNQRAGLGERGNLRDSDPTMSLYEGRRLYNWCCTFKKPVGPAGVQIIG